MVSDVVIITKDRYPQLMQAVQQAKNLNDANNIVVVDSTEHPNTQLLNTLDASCFLTPNAKLGYARQTGLLHTSTTLVAFIDDDIITENDWLTKMAASIGSYGAVSSRILFHDPKCPEVKKLSSYGRENAASSGAVILDKAKVLSVGGWNGGVHYGEDYELSIRLKKAGMPWKTTNNVTCIHPCTRAQYMNRAFHHGYGLLDVIPSTIHSRVFLLMRCLCSALVMPFYYGLRSRDSSIFKLYLLYRWLYFLGYFKGLMKITRKLRLLNTLTKMMKLDAS